MRQVLHEKDLKSVTGCKWDRVSVLLAQSNPPLPSSSSSTTILFLYISLILIGTLCRTTTSTGTSPSFTQVKLLVHATYPQTELFFKCGIGVDLMVCYIYVHPCLSLFYSGVDLVWLMVLCSVSSLCLGFTEYGFRQ